MANQVEEGTLPRISKWLPAALSTTLIIGSAWNALVPLRKGPWFIFAEDDCFYYLRVATNIAAGLGSTFNGIVPTNGYHPLWLAILAGVSCVSANPNFMAAFLAAISFTSTVLTYFLARKLLRQAIEAPVLASALAIIVTFYSIPLLNTGMEVILTIPLLLGVVIVFQDDRIWTRTTFSFGFGLLLALAVLSRLDVMIFASLLALQVCLSRSLRAKLRLRPLVFMTLGFSPVLAYLIFNRFEFHTWLPVSGMAKQLKAAYSISLVPWTIFFKNKSYVLILVAFCLPLSFVPKVRALFTPAQRVLFSSVLLFPWIYIFTLSLLSDWRLWSWYFYSLRIALCVSFCILLSVIPSQRWSRTPIVTVLAVFASIGVIATYKRKPIQQVPEIYAAAQEIKSFADSHPGIYAMGDRAGIPGYLMQSPLVQTEGLVMDKDFLMQIKHQVPLGQALAKYNVRYYVASSEQPLHGCFHAEEPAQAGKDSPHMRAEICEQPLATFEVNGLSDNQAEHWTYIFKVPFDSAP